MLFPSVDSLLKIIDSKYTLVTVSAKRARQIQDHKDGKVIKPKSSKYVGMALEEIQEGSLYYRALEKDL